MGLAGEELRSRCGQGCRSRPQDAGITAGCLTEAGRFDEEHALSVESELVGELEPGSTRFQRARHDAGVKTVALVDKL